MSQVSAAVTDLAGAVVLGGTSLFVRRDLPAWWPVAFAAAALGSAIGAIHHLAFPPATTGDRGSAASFAVAGVALSIALGCLLAGSATTLTARPGRALTALGGLCTVTFLGLALAGRGTVGPLILSQLPSMVSIVAVWAYQAGRARAGARGVLAAFVLTAASAVAFTPPGRTLGEAIDIDPVTLQHLLQLPGMVLIAWAARAAGRYWTRAPALAG